MDNYNSSDNSLKTVVAQLDSENYYNNAQNMVRVKIEDTNGLDRIVKYYDFPLIFTGEYPNPGLHYVLVFTYDTVLDKDSNAISAGDPRLQYPPGYSGIAKLSSKISAGYCILVNSNIKNNTTSHNVGHATNFNADANLPSNKDDIRYSFSPTLNKNYTTTVDDYKGNKDLDNIGIFITDNSIVLKSEGGEIILGPDGISMLGRQTATATVSTNGVMMTNPIGTILPETLMTFPATIKNIPNIDFIMAIGNTVNRMAQTSIAVGKATSIISTIL
jgi:hypothetical protein